jgi:hypothetical protein
LNNAKLLFEWKKGFPYLMFDIMSLPEGDGGNFLEPIHFDQGFAYRPGIVTFFLIQDCYEMDLRMYIASEMPEVSPDAVQAIEVPFTFRPEETLFLTDAIGQETEITTLIPSHTYTLRFEHGKNGEVEGTNMAYLWGRIYWVLTENPVAKILKAGPELVLTMPTELCMTSGAN